MLNILGYMVALPAGLEFLTTPGFAFVINMFTWILVDLVVYFALLRSLRLITKQLPGDLEDIILSIISRPILILIGLFGIDFSFRLLPLLPIAVIWMETLTRTIVILLFTYIVRRFIQDVVVYYGEKWAARTETRVDDVLIPVLNLFGPLILGIVAALLILPMWGINITSVLLGAGVLGLVLGLALQETLGNIFSGLSLLIEAPFRKGDLILLADGRISEVLHLGIRSTMLFSLEQQATIFVPNKILATNMLINMTKPTAEQRYSINVTVSQAGNLAQINQTLFSIANGHPAVLSSEMAAKILNVKDMVSHIRRQAEVLAVEDSARSNLLAEADKNERSLVRLELDGILNAQILDLKEALRNLMRAMRIRETNGLSKAEHQELYCGYISPTERAITATAERAKNWAEIRDPWENETDFWHQRKMWENRNEQLFLQWERLKKTITESDDLKSSRLDDCAKLMLEWLEKEYKVPPGYWKNPSVTVKSLDGSSIRLELCYYVDNIRLEHDGRPDRVRTEISRIIHEKMVENKGWQ